MNWQTILTWVRSFGLDRNKLAQAGHLLAGLVVGSWTGWIGSSIFFILWVGPKEVYLDPQPPESQPFFWDGAIDMAFYSIGLILGVLKRKLIL